MHLYLRMRWEPPGALFSTITGSSTATIQEWDIRFLIPRTLPPQIRRPFFPRLRSTLAKHRYMVLQRQLRRSSPDHPYPIHVSNGREEILGPNSPSETTIDATRRKLKSNPANIRSINDHRRLRCRVHGIKPRRHLLAQPPLWPRLASLSARLDQPVDGRATCDNCSRCACGA